MKHPKAVAKWRAYWEGMDARDCNIPVQHNPYEEQSVLWTCWRAGWYGMAHPGATLKVKNYTY